MKKKVLLMIPSLFFLVGDLYSLSYLQVLIMKIRGDPNWNIYYEKLTPEQKQLFSIEDLKLKILTEPPDAKKTVEEDTQKETVESIINSLKKTLQGQTFYTIYLSQPKESLDIKKYLAIPVEELPSYLQDKPLTISGVNFCYLHGSTCNQDPSGASHIILDRYTPQIVVSILDDNEQQDTITKEVSYATEGEEVFPYYYYPNKEIKVGSGTKYTLNIDLEPKEYLFIKLKKSPLSYIVLYYYEGNQENKLIFPSISDYLDSKEYSLKIINDGEYLKVLDTLTNKVLGEKKVNGAVKIEGIKQISLRDLFSQDNYLTIYPPIYKNVEHDFEIKELSTSTIQIYNKESENLKDVVVFLNINHQINNIFLDGKPLPFCYVVDDGSCVKDPEDKEIKSIAVRVPYINGFSSVLLSIISDSGSFSLDNLKENLVYNTSLIVENNNLTSEGKKISAIDLKDPTLLNLDVDLKYNFTFNDFDKDVLYTKTKKNVVKFLDNVLEIEPTYSNDNKIIKIALNNNILDVIYLNKDDKNYSLEGEVKIEYLPSKKIKNVYYKGKLVDIEPISQDLILADSLIPEFQKEVFIDRGYLKGLNQTLEVEENISIKKLDDSYNYYQVVHVEKVSSEKVEPKDLEDIKKAIQDLGVYLH